MFFLARALVNPFCVWAVDVYGPKDATDCVSTHERLCPALLSFFRIPVSRPTVPLAVDQQPCFLELDPSH